MSLVYPLPAGQEYLPHSIRVVVDAAAAYHECDESNNRSPDLLAGCPYLG